MGRVRLGIAVVVFAAVAVVVASGALAATPQEIYRDYADNGRIDGQYSPADLERVLENAAVQQYGQPSTGGLPPAVEQEIDNQPPAAAAGGQAPSAGVAPVQASGGLPFTGLDLSLIVAGALGLLLLGTALRRVGRQRA